MYKIQNGSGFNHSGEFLNHGDGLHNNYNDEIETQHNGGLRNHTDPQNHHDGLNNM
jgi:hypothetical protein